MHGEATVAEPDEPEDTMRTLKLQRLATALTLGMALVGTCATFTMGTAQAQTTHDHEASAPAALSLNQGRKWSTDDALRGGMTRIRGLVATQLDAAHAGRLSAAQYTALAGRIEGEVGGIVANCKLEPKADAMLHLVIGEIGAGTDAMAGKAAKAKPQQGLVHVAAAVNNYGKYFEHPGFKPIPVGH
jgi:hypothetical protein